MLIVTSKAPGWGKQKPQQYNLAHAQASVRDNCERLGIDPQKIKLLMPFWEGAGLFSSLVNNIKAANGTDGWQWSQQGIALNNGNNAHTSAFSNGSNYNKFTIWGTLILNTLGKCAVFEKYKINYEFGGGFYSATTGLRCYLNSTSSDFETTKLPEVGKPYSFCVTYDGSQSVNNDKMQILIDGEHPAYAHRDVIGIYCEDSAEPLYIGAGVEFSGYSWPDFDGQITNLGFSYDYYGADIGMLLTDSPYALLQPVAPVFYSLPSALVPRITYPTEGLNDVSTTPTISWSAVTGATKYKLQVDTANTFDSGGGSGLLVLDSHSAISKATQKPKQWGPISSVRSAVKKNCESFLHADPEGLKVFSPFYDLTHDLFQNDLYNQQTPSIVKNAVKLDDHGNAHDNDSIYYPSAPSLFRYQLGMTVFLVVSFNSFRGDQYQGILNSKPVLDWRSQTFRLDQPSNTISGDCRTLNYHGFNRTGTSFSPKIKTEYPLSMTTLYPENSAYIRAGGVNYPMGKAGSGLDYVTSSPEYDLKLGMGSYTNYYGMDGNIHLFLYYEGNLLSEQVSTLHEQPYRLLQPTNNKVISIPTKAPLIEEEIIAPATSKQVTLAAGTTHYARVAADTP